MCESVQAALMIHNLGQKLGSDDQIVTYNHICVYAEKKESIVRKKEIQLMVIFLLIASGPVPSKMNSRTVVMSVCCWESQ